MGRLLWAARGPPLSRPPPPLLLLLLLAGGVSLGEYAAGTDEPGPEGLTSTSLLDFLLPTGLEPLDAEEPSEAMGLGAGLGAPGSGFPSEESEESRILQPPQYFWEEEEELNESSLDLGPTADYGFPDLTEKAGPMDMDDAGQAMELPSLPSTSPKLNLVEPPWQVPLEEEEEEEEREKEEVERDEEDEEEELLPVSGSQEEATTQARDFVPSSSSSSSQALGIPGLRHEESGDQAASGVEVESSMEPSSALPSVIPSVVTPGPQELPSQGARATMLLAAGSRVEYEVPQEASEEATVGISRELASSLSSALFLQTKAPARAETPDEDRLYPQIPTPSPSTLGDSTSMLFSAIPGQEVLSQQPPGASAAEAPSRTPWDSTQVICKDWSNLAGKNYIILNMTENIDCEVFRQHRGLQLLALVEEVLPRHRHGHHGDWHISLSKPSEKEQHLLMMLVGEQGVMPTQDVLSMLGDIRRSLEEIGIQNYSTTSSCQARATQVRSDYGTLFVVLVIIGVICFIIIVLGLLYNCWQRRLPKLKHVSHGEELRFVENGCHDNPTLDVASDSQSEMQEKQPSLNGGGALNGPGSWSALMGGKRDPEDSDVFEEDTHL
ncbi:podocalyxin-like protein 2 [Octodon degus]|uniref:Podocalyxin-like protein 2 n=1 Tax=Octodon degus TaxID=10160 RepID=A0A6P3FFZ8_OCTDE|nr:podocalyxin-like protein 2 [Octodon degus]